MDGLIAMFIVIGILRSLSKAAQKKAKKNKPKVPPSVFSQPAKKQNAAPAATPVAAPVFAAAAEGESHAGSMMTGSTEGMDLCDPSLEHDRETAVDPHSVYAEEIGAEHRLDLSPDGLWQGVVMSEILTRPADRQKRKGASWRS